MTIIAIIAKTVVNLYVNTLLGTLESTDSAGRKGYFAWYNCLVLGDASTTRTSRSAGYPLQRPSKNQFSDTAGSESAAVLSWACVLPLT